MVLLGAGALAEGVGLRGAFAGQDALDLFVGAAFAVALGVAYLLLELGELGFGGGESLFAVGLHAVVHFKDFGAQLGDEFFLFGGVGFGAGGAAQVADGAVFGAHLSAHFGAHGAAFFLALAGAPCGFGAGVGLGAVGSAGGRVALAVACLLAFAAALGLAGAAALGQGEADGEGRCV